MKSIVYAGTIALVASAVAGAADLTTGEAVLDNYVTVTGGTAASPRFTT